MTDGNILKTYTNGFTEEDIYDYIYGGTYSGAIASEEHIQSEQQIMLDAFFAALPEASAGMKLKLPFKRNVTLNEYDGLNQLVKVASGNVIANYSNNVDGLRTSKTINSITTNHIWDGQNIE